MTNVLDRLHQATGRGSSADVTMPFLGRAHMGWGTKSMLLKEYLKPVASATPERPVLVLDAGISF